MSNALQGLLSVLAGAVGTLSPIAKAVVAAVLPLATSLVNMALTGSFDTTSIVVLACGAASALLVYFVPNKAQATPVAPVVAPPAPPAK
jgi:hypothetical protein